ncbi:MAG: AMP-binding protein [Betaproteobacteria bacterium]|nr:AMP-binding protein [Betaproteobacteria bacterium]
MNAAELLLAVGEDRHTALVEGEEEISYAELRAAVRRAGGAWHSLGLKLDERVVVLAPDGIQWVVAYLGVIWAGGVAIGVNPRLAMADLAPILVESRVQYVWCGHDLAPGVAALAGTLPRPPRVLTRGGTPGCEDWDAIVSAARGVPAVERAEHDMALWIGTSGTTGTPKSVVHLQRTVLSCGVFAREMLEATAADRFYATSKLFFAYALANSLFAGLRLGGTVILDPEWPTPARVTEIVHRHRPSILFSVPTLYHKMLEAGAAERLAETDVRHYVSAGEALPAAVWRGWHARTGKGIVSGYGTSESLCLVLYCSDDTGMLAPTPLSEVRYPRAPDAAVPRRVWLRHPALARGYWERPDDQADSFAEDWFSPGDMFLRHPKGRYEFTGRNDDMLKISGRWVSTLWVEQAMRAACGDTLQEVAAVGAETREGLTAIAVLAVARPGAEEEARRKLEAEIEQVPNYQKPRWVHWVDALPQTATGKLQRSRLKAMHYQALDARASSGDGSVEERLK